METNCQIVKKGLLVLVVLCAFCSCTKNYPKLVQERVEQYKNEGKTILSQSNDDTGKLHYVVFGDPKANAIGIDTIGEEVKYIKLGKKKGIRITPYVYEDGKGLRFFQNDGEHSYSFSGKFCSESGIPMKMLTYKNKYILLEREGDMPVLLFFDKPNIYYPIEGTPKVKNGDIEISFNKYVKFVFYPEKEYMENVMFGGTDRFLLDKYTNYSYQITLSPDGNIIKKAGMGYLGSVEIPDEALCSLATLLPYIDEAKDRGWQEAMAKQMYESY